MANIHVTKSFLPPIEEYQAYVAQIWESGQLTNQGPLLQEFEDKARQYLGVEHFHFVANGTIALQLALRALDITEGEVITTPFTYVATTSAILWERCTPVFIDIDPDTYCMDADKIETAITPKTKAILPVHVFGLPGDIAAIDAIAKKHNLRVLYDGAHAFGSSQDGISLLNHGDISISSFHATKPFHTIEGGCIITKDKGISDKVELLKRFGHTNDEYFTLGINAKASEFQAAMGLCNLKYIDSIIQDRRIVTERYDELLAHKFPRPKLPEGFHYNYAYYPVLLHSEQELLQKTAELGKKHIYPRRYFYPSLNTLPYIKNGQACPVSEDIARRILCLPLYGSLEKSSIEDIAGVLLA